MSSQPSQPSQISSPSPKLLSSPAPHPQYPISSNTPIQPTKPENPENENNPNPQTPHAESTTPSPFLIHALRKKKKKDLKAAREEEKKKSREIEEGKSLFGGMVAEVWRVRSELKIEHPDVADSVLEQEAWKLVGGPPSFLYVRCVADCTSPVAVSMLRIWGNGMDG
ncbi:hypothetical protein BPAE_0002g01820 [Botrytis paeoniae]|uniref:Uncharacterized protein n=1 Tax=Botrytis paeoniae TaxID=278948 RepID=A0A4Z1G239_9HELO|nr:hypothetical protein BPAE_0002g01820 [Botrytis paeoniae]